MTLGLKRLADVSQAITAKLTTNEVLQHVVDAIASEVAGVDLVGFFQPRPGTNLLAGAIANKVPVVPNPETGEPMAVPVTSLEIDLDQDAFVREIVTTRRPLYVADAESDPRVDPMKVQLLGIRSVFGLPVEYESELFGVIFLHDQGKAMDLPLERRLLIESFVAMASVAVNNARLFRDQERLIQATRQLAACRTLQEVNDTCFRHIVEIAGVETAGIHLLRQEPDGAYLEPTYLRDTDVISREEWHERHRRTGRINVKDDPLFREVIREQKLVAVEDVEADPRPDHEKCRIFDIRSLMVIPLVAGGEVLGTIAVPSIGRSSQFPPSVRRLCKSIADSTAIALNNAYTATHLEDLICQKTGELTDANERLQDLVAELRSLDRAKSEFIAVVSHEFRTPIHVVMQLLELFDEGLLGEISDDQRKYLLKMAEQVQKLHEQVEDLLDASKLASGTFKVHVEWVGYRKVVAKALEAVEPAAKAKGLRITTHVAGDPQVFADPKRLHQVLVNLLSNAVKFTPAGGQIAIAVRDLPGEVETVVKDEGIGIPEAALPHIFDRFYQVDGSLTRRYAGTGLGLSIVKSLIELHGGTIDVTSEVGAGSRFRFVIPKEGAGCEQPSTP